MARREGELEALLRRTFLSALRSFDLAARVRERLGSRRRGRVLAVGKAAATMLGAAWAPSVERALLIVPEGSPVAWASPRVTVLFAPHPEPGPASVAAATTALEFARAGLDLALVSGGASSLLVQPAEGVTLEQKLAALRRLADAGVSVRALNLVRRHLSAIKGGGLARACGGALRSLILSDVIGGGDHDVGSGPTVPDPTTCEEARALLSAHGLDLPLHETLKPSDAPPGLGWERVASPRDFAAHLARGLEAQQLEVALEADLEGDVQALADRWIARAAELGPRRAVVCSAEPTLALGPRAKRGGRSTHLATLVGPRLPEGVALLCGATDGVDGSSGGAGAVVARGAIPGERAREAALRFDTGSLHRACGTLIDAGGPTGLNLCDVHVLARLG